MVNKWSRDCSKMKKRYLIPIIVFAVIIVVVISSFLFYKFLPTKILNWEEMSSCNVDSDCIVVGSGGCCNSHFAINKNYEDEWNFKHLKYEIDRKLGFCKGVLCEASIYYSRAICVENRCQGVM